jgi:ribosomal protein L35AE/L33A
MSENAINVTEGVFCNYQSNRHGHQLKHSIIKFPGVETRKDSYKLIGKIVGWTSVSGKVLKGRIAHPHGKNGAVVAIFTKAGLPGQAIGEKIVILK